MSNGRREIGVVLDPSFEKTDGDVLYTQAKKGILLFFSIVVPDKGTLDEKSKQIETTGDLKEFKMAIEDAASEPDGELYKKAFGMHETFHLASMYIKDVNQEHRDKGKTKSYILIAQMTEDMNLVLFNGFQPVKNSFLSREKTYFAIPKVLEGEPRSVSFYKNIQIHRQISISPSNIQAGDFLTQKILKYDKYSQVVSGIEGENLDTRQRDFNIIENDDDPDVAFRTVLMKKNNIKNDHRVLAGMLESKAQNDVLKELIYQRAGGGNETSYNFVFHDRSTDKNISIEFGLRNTTQRELLKNYVATFLPLKLIQQRKNKNKKLVMPKNYVLPSNMEHRRHLFALATTVLSTTLNVNDYIELSPPLEQSVFYFWAKNTASDVANVFPITSAEQTAIDDKKSVIRIEKTTLEMDTSRKRELVESEKGERERPKKREKVNLDIF